MKYEDAKKKCHVRSGIFRVGNPRYFFSRKDLNKIHPRLRDLSAHKVGTLQFKVYWYNHTIPIDDRVPDRDKRFTDWEEYDPRSVCEN